MNTIEIISASDDLALTSESLVIYFSKQAPLILEYFYKKTNQCFLGHPTNGYLIIDNKNVKWDEFIVKINQNVDDLKIIYKCEHIKRRFILKFIYQLKDFELNFHLEIQDFQKTIQTINWIKLPFIQISDKNFYLWRENWKKKSWKAKWGKGTYRCNTKQYNISRVKIDEKSNPTLHCCAFNKYLCISIYNNFRVWPVFTQIISNKHAGKKKKILNIGINKYIVHTRGVELEPLSISIVFLGDYNKDGVVDTSDYFLWLNRHLPSSPNQIHDKHIWYKIFQSKPGLLRSNLPQTKDIIKAIANITDNYPQIPFLVGWQFKGHDTDYPALNILNKELGEQEDFSKLFKEAEEQYNAFVSCHINIDDAYKHSSQWDEALMTQFKDGTLIPWEKFNNEMSYHLSHTKDVESGSIFKRLTEFFEILPVKKAIHMDAMRNTNVSWEPDGYISEIEELECGLKQIFNFFYERGIDISTEGLFFHPTEFIGLFSAIWHFSRRYGHQIYHGKLVGGGYRKLSNYTAGMGWSIHRDIDFDEFLNNWEKIVDKIYLGVLLSHFLNPHEMLSTKWRPWCRTYKIIYSDNIIAKCRFGFLKIYWSDILIANNSDRFIPLRDKIYIYSKRGGKKCFLLPENWRSKDFKAIVLSAEGQQDFNDYQIINNQIILTLSSRKPIILKR